MIKWKLIKEDTILPDDFFDMDGYERVECSRAGHINKRKYILDTVLDKDLQAKEYDEYIGAGRIEKWLVRQIIFGDPEYVQIRFRERTVFDKKWNSNDLAIVRLLKGMHGIKT